MRVNIFLLIVAGIMLGNFITFGDTKDFERRIEDSKKLFHKLNPFDLSSKLPIVCSKGVEEKW